MNFYEEYPSGMPSITALYKEPPARVVLTLCKKSKIDPKKEDR
jgi:hypothetical protein